MDRAVQNCYENNFKAKDYLEMYFASGKGALLDQHWLPFVARKMFETFSSGAVKGDLLIDIGSGPSIYHLMSACEAFKKIIATDFTESNRKELEAWLKNEPGAFDWSPIVKIVCELEGDSGKWREKEEKMRRTIQKQVLQCDVLQGKPLGSIIVPPADCITSTLVLEAACTDVDSFYAVLKNLKAMLKPGGYLVLASVFNSTFYYVGQARFKSIVMTQDVLEKALRDAGFEIVDLEVIKRTDMSTMHLADYDCSYFVLAQYPKD